MTILAVLAGLAAVVIVLAYLGRQAVLEGRFLPILRPLYQLLLPPSDLYTPLVDVPIELAKASTYGAQYEHRYAGLYAAELTVDQPIAMGSKEYPFDGELVISVSPNGAVQFSPIVGQELSPYWGASRNGFVLAHYRVPEDLPRGKPLTATIQILRPAQKFHEKYGAARLIIVKVSEK